MAEKEGEILSKLRKLDPYSFESLLAELWSLYGYNTETTSGSADKGIDIRAERNFPYDETILIQAKRYGENSAVSSPEMQKYASLSQREGVDIVIVASTGEFTQQARTIADDFNIKCIGANQLVQMITQEDATELIEKHAGDITSSSTIEPVEDGTKSPKPEIGTTSALGETENAVIELIGYKYKYSQSLMLYFVDLTNKTEVKWHSRTNDFSVTSTDGYEYNPDFSGSYESLPAPWQSPKADVSSNSTVRMILPFNSGSKFKPEKVQYSETEIKRDSAGDISDTIRIDVSTNISQDVRENLAGCPDGVHSSDISIYLN